MNKVSNVCKKSAIFIGILGGIGSIAYAYNMGTLSGNIVIFLAYALVGGFSTFLLCLLFYALGEIIELQSRIVEKTESTNRKNTLQGPNKNVSNDRLDLLSIQDENQKNSTWICKNCGSKNQSNTRFCKDCGTYK